MSSKELQNGCENRRICRSLFILLPGKMYRCNMAAMFCFYFYFNYESTVLQSNLNHNHAHEKKRLTWRGCHTIHPKEASNTLSASVSATISWHDLTSDVTASPTRQLHASLNRTVPSRPVAKWPADLIPREAGHVSSSKLAAGD